MTETSDANEPRVPSGYPALSALMDGEAAHEEIPAACDAWRQDAVARQRWHAYQLIGDVLRSDDLAMKPQRDAALIQAVRARLAAEPVILAPTSDEIEPMPVPAQGVARLQPSRRWGLWTAPAAAAAGFVAVAGVMALMRPHSLEPSAATLASAAGLPASASVATFASDTTPDPRFAAKAEIRPAADMAVEADFVRDPELDRYLAAHRQFNIGGPGGLRSVVAIRPPGP